MVRFACNRHGITRATGAGVNFAYDQNVGLTRVNLERELILRIRAFPFVCDPVVADIIRIKAAQIRGCEDEVGFGASRIHVHRHALSRADGVRKRIGIVMDCSSGEG